ncbi:hypothetical protein BV25DRAFT_1818183 [Artomyces pyxidatus]|uniref:Uncharacterized protein n=1 Tax=Artomyces pyxidatus TaxID=48021 RepID=A0ACB8TLG6_9AGAM|nr:hypothetical protein BV25DRAFT_1818183 [Artomyces pyxidatus]
MGATYIGVVLSAALWGVTFLQTWYYYREYPSDPWHFKLLVGSVFMLDTLHQIFISHTIYLYLVTNYFNPPFLGEVTWSILAEVLVAGLVALIVQSFFISRIYTLSKKNMFLTGGVAVLVVAQFMTVLVYCSKAFRMTTYVEIATIKGWSMSINATTAASDLAIALVLCGLLHNSRTGFRRSDTMINKLILFTVNTGVLTSVDAICSLATIAALPNSFVYICFFFALGRLYANSLLATLNARASLRSPSEDASSISLTGMPRQNNSSTNALGTSLQSRGITNNIAIKIDTTKEFNRDISDGASENDRKHDDSGFV